MAISISTTRSSELPLSAAEQIHSKLTKPGSEMHAQMGEVVRCLRGEKPLDLAGDWPMSICLWTDPYTDILHCIGWVSVTEWDRCLALQGFVDPEYRQKGLATALTAALLVDGVIHQQVPTAVFSDEFAQITRGLGFSLVYRYRQTDDGWIKSEEKHEPEVAARLGEE